MTELATHSCPICSSPVPHQARYPKAVCLGCFKKACDNKGRLLSFYNIDAAGGYKAIVAATGEEYHSHVCYINGVKCYADEARFGGIVIEVAQ